MRYALGLLLTVMGLFFKSQGIQEEWIIFIHGTFGLRQHLELKTFITLFKEDISQSDYKKTIDILRDDPFLYKNQPMQQLGLHEIMITTEKHPHGAQLFAQLFDKLYYENSSHAVKYFTFGWSGVVSHKIRYLEALKLYQALREKIQEAAKNGITPKISIYGYSHGGNVILNLAQVRHDYYPDDTFAIDHIILLGTPIQKETDYHICNPLFTKATNIYSRADRIQKLDCFSFRRFFSYRRFHNCRRYKLPSKLRQIEIRIRDHINDRDYDRSPGHIELWFFGWPEHKKALYRGHFPLHPLPVILFIPQILDTVEQTAQSTSVVIELLPYLSKITVRTRYRRKKTWTDFLPYEKISRMQEEARQNKPDSFDRSTYLAHIKTARQLERHHKNMCPRHQKRNGLCGC